MSVSEFALGTMMFGAMGNADHDESVGMIHSALDAGINFVDTAGLPMGSDPNQRGGSPRWIKTAVENSLRRLGTDHIDLYQMHRPDTGTDIDATLSALSDLVRAGKVRAIGSSFFSPEQTVEAQWTAERRGHHRFRTEQPPYSILTRGIESSVLPTARRYGMGVLTFGPLNSGWLSGRTDPTSGHRSGGRGAPMFDLSQPGVQAKADAVDKLTKLAAEAGLPLPHLAVAFVLAHPAITSVLIGPRRPEHLADLLAGAEVELSEDVLDRIDEIVPPGVDVNPGDLYIDPAPAIADKRLRRR